jgi:hypothetical protein
VVPQRSVVSRDDVLDLVGQEGRRVDVARARGPEEERHLTAVTNGLVGEHPDARHAEPAGDQEQVARPRIDLERPSQRPEHVEPVARPQPRQPLGAPADRPEMDCDRARGGVRGVDRERPPEDEPRQVARPDVDELAGP